MRQFRLAREPYFLPATVLVLRQHLRKAGLPGSMGTIGDDNAVMESFWGTLGLELLDTRAREPAKNLVSRSGLLAFMAVCLLVLALLAAFSGPGRPRNGGAGVRWPTGT